MKLHNTTMCQSATTSQMQHVKCQLFGSLNVFVHECVFLLVTGYNSNEHSWLRHCATGRNVASSIPDWVIGIFPCLYPSSLTVALGSTHPVTETGIFPGGKGGRCVQLTLLLPSCAACLEILGTSLPWSPQILSRTLYV